MVSSRRLPPTSAYRADGPVFERSSVSFCWQCPAMAGQGAGTAAGITGVVADNSGAVLPGGDCHGYQSRRWQVPSVTSVSDDRGEVPPVAVADWRLQRSLRAGRIFKAYGARPCG